jgi:acyl-homoserine lactone synthase
MFQMHAIDASNHTAYRAYLEAHFRIRHSIYVGERRWLDLERPDGREIDAFDTPSAICLLGIVPERGVVVGSRLVPRLQPHILSEVFPQLSEAPVPRAADIFEWTRFFVIPALREPGRPSRAAGIVYCGILEFCLNEESAI